MSKLQHLFPTANQYNIWLIIPIFFMVYVLLIRLNAKMKKKAYETKNSKQHGFNKKCLNQEKHFESEMDTGHLKRIDNKLRKQGYPLGLTGSTYYLVKTIIFILCFLLGFRSYGTMRMALILGLGGFFIIDLYIFLNRFIRDNAIKNDLFNVADFLYLQISAYMTLKDSLRGLHEVCKNKDLRKALIRLSVTYELSELNIEKAADEFKAKFDIIEVDMFAIALKQQTTTGISLDVLKNIIEILKESYLDKLNFNTKIKILYITLGVSLVLLNIVALTFFPIFINVGENLQDVFR